MFEIRRSTVIVRALTAFQATVKELLILAMAAGDLITAPLRILFQKQAMGITGDEDDLSLHPVFGF